MGASLASAPLPQALEVTGNPIVTLQIAAEGRDANIFAYLEDVPPDGQVQVITEGRLKASLRALNPPPFRVPGTPWHCSYAADARALEPDQPVTLHFDLMPTSYIVPRGHRIQLTITGADDRERNRDPKESGMRIDVSSTPASPSYIELAMMARRR
ncbi:MAG: CocE/NonD family hydrolase C-terminal non-catalytic domain-containing protein [Steroidobacteraceae bacterium]